MTNSRLRTLARPSFFLLTGLLSVAPVFAADPPAIPAETPAEAAHRHEVVATRRKGAVVICHRGASELAHENTLEAFRATFELGGDGNEFDIRTTKDGVLVVFHDDMLDRLLEAYGDVGDYTWQELQRFRFRDPGQFGEQCRIPTLVEVFDLHRKYGGLIHLDIKRPGQDKAIADLLTRMDLWDHVAFCNEDNAGVILQDPRLKLLRYKAPGLYADHTDVFPEAVAAALKKPGDGVIVDDPRAAIVALGRKLGQLSKEPVAPKPPPSRKDEPIPAEADLIAVLRNADDWNRAAETDVDKAASGGASAPAPWRQSNCWRPKHRRRKRSRRWRSECVSAACTRTGCTTASMAPMALRSLILLGAPQRRRYGPLRPVARRPGPGAGCRSALEEPALLDRLPRQDGDLPGAGKASGRGDGEAVSGLPGPERRGRPEDRPAAV